MVAFGDFLSKFWNFFSIAQRKVKILLVGLDHSGKTTILTILKNSRNGLSKFDSTVETIPTVGFNVETLTKDKLQITVFDMSGQGRYREIWSHYYPDTDALIFVIDASDKARCCVVRDELAQLLEHPAFQLRHRGSLSSTTSSNSNNGGNSANGQSSASRIPILFFLNKTDVEGALTVEEARLAIGLVELEQNGRDGNSNSSPIIPFEWHIQPCQAINGGIGLYEGFNWLTGKYKSISICI